MSDSLSRAAGHEISREDVTDRVYPSIEVVCPDCGSTHYLFCNGGELDRKRCHGYEWETEATKIELVTRQAD